MKAALKLILELRYKWINQYRLQVSLQRKVEYIPRIKHNKQIITVLCMYVCMYQGWAKRSGACTATFNDLLCCPFLINPLLILHLKWSVGLYLWGCHSSHLVPWKTGPGDEILNILWPHNHIGYVGKIKEGETRLKAGSFLNVGDGKLYKINAHQKT
jgi:hypothetical protein